MPLKERLIKVFVFWWFELSLLPCCCFGFTGAWHLKMAVIGPLKNALIPGTLYPLSSLFRRKITDPRIITPLTSPIYFCKFCSTDIIMPKTSSVNSHFEWNCNKNSIQLQKPGAVTTTVVRAHDIWTYAIPNLRFTRYFSEIQCNVGLSYFWSAFAVILLYQWTKLASFFFTKMLEISGRYWYRYSISM